MQGDRAAVRTPPEVNGAGGDAGWEGSGSQGSGWDGSRGGDADWEGAWPGDTGEGGADDNSRWTQGGCYDPDDADTYPGGYASGYASPAAGRVPGPGAAGSGFLPVPGPAALEDDATETAVHELIAAGRLLFAELGYAHTQFAEIAAAAGMRPEDAYAVLPGRAAVLRAFMERSIKVAGLLREDREEDPDEDLPVRFARDYLSLWEPCDEQSPLVEACRIALHDEEAAAVLGSVLGARLEGLTGDDAVDRLGLLVSHAQLTGIAVLRHVVGVEPLASAGLDEIVGLLGPSLRMSALR